MRAYQVQTADGFEQIARVTLPQPECGPEDVRIRFTAASLNYRDFGVADGGYYRNNACPVIPVSDGAGEVVEVGADVSRWQVGQRVSPIFVRDWIDGPPSDATLRTCLGGGIDGVLAEFGVFPQDSVVPLPDELTDAEAATLPCAGVTAWHALVVSGRLQAGQTVLLLGTGGVSIFALQIAKAMGARVVVTSSSDEKLAHVTSMGADAVVNYRTHPDWHKEVMRLTDGVGVDHVVEVGGPGTLERSLKCTRVSGHVHLIGLLDSPTARVGPMAAVMNLITVRGIYVGSREMHQQLLSFLVEHQIHPLIDRSFDFEQAHDAYRHLASQQHMGKVVIEF